MKLFAAFLIASLASADSQSLESALSDLSTLAATEGSKVWQQANFQMIRVLRDLEQQHSAYKRDRGDTNAKMLAESTQRVSQTLIDIQQSLEMDTMKLTRQEANATKPVQASKKGKNLREKANHKLSPVHSDELAIQASIAQPHSLYLDEGSYYVEENDCVNRWYTDYDKWGYYGYYYIDKFYDCSNDNEYTLI